MTHDFGVSHPNRGAVGGGVEAQHNALAGPAARHPRRGLIPHVPDVVMERATRHNVVVARRNRHVACPRQGGLPPALPTTAAGAIHGKTPDTVQAFRSRTAFSIAFSIAPAPVVGR